MSSVEALAVFGDDAYISEPSSHSIGPTLQAASSEKDVKRHRKGYPLIMVDRIVNDIFRVSVGIPGRYAESAWEIAGHF